MDRSRKSSNTTHGKHRACNLKTPYLWFLKTECVDCAHIFHRHAAQILKLKLCFLELQCGVGVLLHPFHVFSTGHLLPQDNQSNENSTGYQYWICGTEHGNYVSAGQYQCHGWLCVSSSATKVQGCCWQHEQQKRCEELWYLKTTLPPPHHPPLPPPNWIVSTNRTCQQNS